MSLGGVSEETECVEEDERSSPARKEEAVMPRPWQVWTGVDEGPWLSVAGRVTWSLCLRGVSCVLDEALGRC